MKLSQAIQIGINHYKGKAVDTFFEGDCACIIACAIYGTFGIEDEDLITELETEYPVLEELSPEHPQLKTKCTLSDALSFLNDDTPLTLIQIHNWLKQNDL